MLNKEERLRKKKEKERLKLKKLIEKDKKRKLKNANLKKERKKVWINYFEWLGVIFIPVLIGLGLIKYAFFMINVPTGSMIPTINLQDKIWVKKIYNLDTIKRGDIIVFNSNQNPDGSTEEKPLIKRLIGLPGDQIEIKKGVVIVNGVTLDEPYVKNNMDFDGSYKVPEGKYFFLGDNRASSYDSRMWQDHFVDKSKIVAKAGLKVVPFKDFGFLK